MALYWFIPAFANNRVGSERGTTEDDGTGSGICQLLTTEFLEVLRTRTYRKYAHAAESSLGMSHALCAPTIQDQRNRYRQT